MIIVWVDGLFKFGLLYFVIDNFSVGLLGCILVDGGGVFGGMGFGVGV